jgi:hypothetical protein
MGSAWILVLRPPLLRLIGVDLSGARAVLMCPHHGAVDHRIFIVGILG